jgi:hypothetical protein
VPTWLKNKDRATLLKIIGWQSEIIERQDAQLGEYNIRRLPSVERIKLQISKTIIRYLDNL